MADETDHLSRQRPERDEIDDAQEPGEHPTGDGVRGAGHGVRGTGNLEWRLPNGGFVHAIVVADLGLDPFD
jgi:hypothetical protein